MPYHLLTETAQYLMSWQSSVPRGPGGMHSHQALEIVFHRSGNGVIDIAGERSLPFKHNQLEIMPAGKAHSQLQHVQGVDCCVLFKLPDTTESKINTCLSLQLTPDEYAAHELCALSVLPKPQTDFEQSIVNHRLSAVLLDILRRTAFVKSPHQPCRQEELAMEAQNYLRQNWRDIRCIQQIADKLAISTDYLRHLFQSSMGITIYDYLTQLRIDHAKDLLINSQLPQKTIARVCGYADIQQFSRRFSQVAGVSPGKYRKQI